MTSGYQAGIAGLVLSVGLGSPGAGAAPTGVDQRTGIELRVSTYALNPSEVEAARQTTEALLATAGVKALWRPCRGDDCKEPSHGRVYLRVLLLPILKESDLSISGEVARDPATGVPTVLVYVPRAKDVADAIRRSQLERAPPDLSTLTTGNVAGLAIAHELGHSLGLGHGPSGPMKAEPNRDDLIALRASRLRFQPGEAEALRASIVAYACDWSRRSSSWVRSTHDYIVGVDNPAPELRLR